MSRTNQGLFKSFMEGYQFGKKLKQDKEIKDVMEAKPEKTTINETSFQGMTGSLDEQDMPVQSKSVTQFLGKTFDKEPTERDLDRTRLIAMSGIYSKFGNPEEGLKLRQQATQSEILDRQNKRGEEEDRLSSLRKEADTKTSEYLKSRQKLDPDGKPMPLSDDDFVNASKFRTFALSDAGLFDDAVKSAEQGMSYVNRLIDSQTKERTQAFGQAAGAALQGNYEPLKNAYNKYIPDGAAIETITPNRDGTVNITRKSTVDGASLGQQTVPLDKLLASAETLVDPKSASQYLERTFKNDIETRRLKLAENADSRAASADARDQTRLGLTIADKNQRDTEKKAEADAKVAIYQEQNPGASKAQIEAVRRGVIDAVNKPRADSFSMSTDNYGNSATLFNKSTGAMTIVNPRTGAIVKEIDPAKAKQAQEKAQPKKLQNVTEEDIKATAKMYKMTEDEVRKRLQDKGSL